MGMDQDDLILAPYTTIQKKVLAITHLQGITCSALKEEYTDQAIDEISEIPRAATESMRQESGKGEDKKGKKARV